MDHGLAHLAQDRIGGGERIGAAADHERQRAGIGRRDAARNRRVDYAVAAFGGGGGHRPGGDPVDRGAIDQQGMGRGDAEHLGFIDRTDMAAGGQHGDDDLGIGDGIRGGSFAPATGIARAFQRIGGQIIGPHGMPGADEIGCHATAHIAKADKGDSGHVSLSAVLESFRYRGQHAKFCRACQGRARRTIRRCDGRAALLGVATMPLW